MERSCTPSNVPNFLSSLEVKNEVKSWAEIRNCSDEGGREVSAQRTSRGLLACFLNPPACDRIMTSHSNVHQPADTYGTPKTRELKTRIT